MGYSLPNEQVEVKRTVEHYKLFLGKNTEQMPLLLGEGRSPLWSVRFMRRRIEHASELPDLIRYLDVSDLIAYDSKKRSTDVKLILTVDKNGRVTEQGRKALELINPNAKLTSGYAVNIDDIYESLPGIVVARRDLGVLERDLTEKEILENKAWRILARHPDEVPAEFAENPDLLKEYVGWVKGQTRQDRSMGVYLDSNSKDAKLKAWCVGWIGSRSDAGGRNGLADDGGRLVGYLAPEALSISARQNDRPSEQKCELGAPSMGTSNIRAYSMADVQTARKQLDQIAEFMKPESVDKVKSLLEKL